MVERPIKKSERQATDKPSSDAAGFQESEAADSGARNSEERGRSRPSRDKGDRNDKGGDRGKRKGRGRDQEDDRAKTPANPALMRGPKPTQPKPPVVQPEPEVEENATAEADSEVATES